MLGRPGVAAAGQLGIIPAGPAEAVQCCRPIFEAMGRRTFEAGADPASASALKIANTFMMGCAIEAMGEAFALVRKCGAQPSALYDILTEGLFGAPAYKVYGNIIAERDYDRVGFTAALGLLTSP